MTGLGTLMVERMYGRQDAADPVAWVEERLGEETWSKQREIMWSVRDNRRTAVKSCHGPGKSHVASRIVAQWLDDNPAGMAFAVTTAPTFDQVRAILWRYIGQAHRKAKLRGRVNQTEWHIGDEIVGYGRKPSDYDESTFQGIHAEKVLVVLDEACGIAQQLWVAVDSLLTNEDCRVLAIGNPDNPDTQFFKVCQPGSGWNVITISAYDTPNFTGEPVSRKLSKQLVGKTYVDDAIKNWGKDSPLFISKVLGEFPEDSSDGVIPNSKLAECRNREVYLSTIDDDVQLGVDVGAGGDQSVIRERRNDTAGRVWRSRHDDPMKLVGEIITAIRETQATRCAIDVIGVGWGIAGRLEEVIEEDDELTCDVIKVNVGEAATEPKRFVNQRAELWWQARERTMAGAWNLKAIDDDTAADLTAPRYDLDSKGRVKVEKKSEVRERLGRSPDDADALLLAFCDRQVRVKIHQASDMRRSVRGGRPGRATVGTR